MAARFVIFFVSTVLVLSESIFVEPRTKCNSRDSECLKNYFQSVIRMASKNGIPEIRIPPFDPTIIKNYQANITGWLEMQMLDGIGTGGKTCTINKFFLNVPKNFGSVDFVCDLEVHGHYKAFSDSPLIRNLLNGDVIHGDGNGFVKLEKVRFVIDFPFNVVSHGGDTYLNTDFSQSQYSFNILRGMVFGADNLYLGNQEASATIINTMNQHWQMIAAATGPKVFESIFKYIFHIGQTFFHSVPVKTYLTDDLTPYAIVY